MKTNEIEVGPQSNDLRGSSGRHIQMAIDALVRRGGGTLQLTAGEFVLSDSLRMGANITLRGVGPTTILKRIPVVSSPVLTDADKAQSEISPQQPELFAAGMGVVMHCKKEHHRYMPRYITHIEDGILYLDDFLDKDYIAENGAVVVNEFPMIHGFRVDDVVIENLQIDGGAKRTDTFGSPGIYARRSERWQVRQVHIKNCIGDGLIFSQQSLHGLVEDCEFENCTNYGVHPGSHSAYCTVRRCHIHHNGADGLYICWGIKGGTFTHNEIHHNGWKLFRHGISIGHKDTDCLISDNHIYENWKHGIHVREKTEANGAHRNVFRNNLIENNGTLPEQVPERWRGLPADELMGYGVSLCGISKDLVFEHNIIRETRAAPLRAQKYGIFVGQHITGLRCEQNQISGHLKDFDDRAQHISNQLAVDILTQK